MGVTENLIKRHGRVTVADEKHRIREYLSVECVKNYRWVTSPRRDQSPYHLDGRMIVTTAQACAQASNEIMLLSSTLHLSWYYYYTDLN